MVLLASLVGLVSIVVGARMYQIQLAMCERFRIRARDQHRTTTEVPAIRGAILDRRGRELAASVETRSLFAHPRRVEHPEEAARLLAEAIGRPREAILRDLRSDRSFVYLKRFLDAGEIERVRALGLPLEGNSPFGMEPVYERVYPLGRLGAHVVGFANIDGDGVEGIEKAFDEQLKGDPAVYLVLQDARSGRVRELIHPPEKEPLDVVLSIDSVLQHITERELDQAMRETGARAASAVLIDPATGQVLALANRPTADLGRYGKARARERIDRAVTHIYEPGSTFKVVTMAAALEHGKVRAGQRVFCENGAYVMRGRTIHDISPHGTLSAREILEKSSNIGMVKLVQSLKPDQLRESVLRFGFGSKTGIELPGESRGQVSAPRSWSGHTQASWAFGQEIGVTVLQMAAALATIANDGVAVPPRVVLGTLDPQGSFLQREPPRPRRVLPHATARRITAMLEGVIENGTGSRASVPGYRIAGKSGTAQMSVPGGYSDTDYMASFGGFGPVGAPRLAALVVLDSPRGPRRHGGQVAAPVFRRIMTEALRQLRAPSDRDPAPSELLVEAAVPTLPPFRMPVAAEPGVLPDLIGLSLREAVATLSAHGYEAQVRGSGFVTGQRPAAGQPLEPGGTCALSLEELQPQRVAAREPAGAGGAS